MKEEFSILQELKLQNALQKHILSVEDASLITGYKVSYLYQLSSSDPSFPAYSNSTKKGSKIFINREELEQWCTSKKKNSQADITKSITNYLIKKQ